MPLFDFLAELMQRYGISLSLDAWFFSAVQAIGFLPREQIEAILRAYGHAVIEPVCGITAMSDDGRFHRSVPWIWIAEPDAVCRVQDIPYSLLHELRHSWEWVVNGVQVWPGHD